jgi:hypothetical protein
MWLVKTWMDAVKFNLEVQSVVSTGLRSKSSLPLTAQARRSLSGKPSILARGSWPRPRPGV